MREGLNGETVLLLCIRINVEWVRLTHCCDRCIESQVDAAEQKVKEAIAAKLKFR